MKYIILLLCLTSLSSQAQVSFDGFVDLYYAHDSNQPPKNVREFTTQPSRHDQFNVNLALIGLNYKKDRLSARVSLHAGTYVESAYVLESTKNIQDALIYFQLSDAITFVAGVMPSNLGYENVHSIDNYTYTRSLAADFSPYYHAGLGVWMKFGEHTKLEGYVLNGWQNIDEDDSNKAIATSLRFARAKWRVNYTNFFGRYLERSRQFHDFNVEWLATDSFSLKALYDIGFDERRAERRAQFSTFNIQLYAKLAERHAMSVRYETYRDPEQINVTTPTNRAFKVEGGSIGYDYTIQEGALLRAEYRRLQASQEIFSDKNDTRKTSHLLVSSLSVRF